MEWIKTDAENLPVYDEYVLVYGLRRQTTPQMGGNKPVVIIARRQDLRKSSIWKDRDKYQDKNQFSMMEDVTHWMPLPSPPQTNNNGR